MSLERIISTFEWENVRENFVGSSEGDYRKA